MRLRSCANSHDQKLDIHPFTGCLTDLLRDSTYQELIATNVGSFGQVGGWFGSDPPVKINTNKAVLKKNNRKYTWASSDPQECDVQWIKWVCKGVRENDIFENLVTENKRPQGL